MSINFLDMTLKAWTTKAKEREVRDDNIFCRKNKQNSKRCYEITIFTNPI